MNLLLIAAVLVPVQDPAAGLSRLERVMETATEEMYRAARPLTPQSRDPEKRLEAVDRSIERQEAAVKMLEELLKELDPHKGCPSGCKGGKGCKAGSGGGAASGQGSGSGGGAGRGGAPGGSPQSGRGAGRAQGQGSKPSPGRGSSGQKAEGDGRPTPGGKAGGQKGKTQGSRSRARGKAEGTPKDGIPSKLALGERIARRLLEHLEEKVLTVRDLEGVGLSPQQLREYLRQVERVRKRVTTTRGSSSDAPPTFADFLREVDRELRTGKKTVAGGGRAGESKGEGKGTFRGITEGYKGSVDLEYQDLVEEYYRSLADPRLRERGDRK